MSLLEARGLSKRFGGVQAVSALDLDVAEGEVVGLIGPNGAGTVLGPVVGSFILSPLAELSRHYFAQGGWHGAHLIVYGALLIGVVLFLPEGAYPRLVRALGRRRDVA